MNDEVLKKIEIKKKYSEKIRPQIISKFKEVIEQIQDVVDKFDITLDGPEINSIAKKGWKVCFAIIKGKLFVRYRKEENEKIVPISEANIHELINLAQTLNNFSEEVLTQISAILEKQLDDEIEKMEKFIEKSGEAYKQYEEFYNRLKIIRDLA